MCFDYFYLRNIQTSQEWYFCMLNIQRRGSFTHRATSHIAKVKHNKIFILCMCISLSDGVSINLRLQCMCMKLRAVPSTSKDDGEYFMHFNSTFASNAHLMRLTTHSTDTWRTATIGIDANLLRKSIATCNLIRWRWWIGEFYDAPSNKLLIDLFVWINIRLFLMYRNNSADKLHNTRRQ